MRSVYTLVLILVGGICLGQVSNSGFRNWTFVQDSFGFSTYIPSDTFSYLQLDNWTSSNQLTGNPSSGGTLLVNRDSDATLGKYVVRFNTDSIYIAGTLDKGIVVPGFIVNGNFRFDLAAILFSSGGVVDPATVEGAGSPVSQRYDNIGAWVKYTPIAGDSLLIWAVLKRQGAQIATVKIFSTQTYNSYTYIGGRFAYSSCDMPDTVVVMIASSNPDFSTLLSGFSGLNPGSVMLLDSVSLTGFSGPGYPIASSYSAFTFENQSKKVYLLSADTDCSGLLLTASISGQPVHGSAVLIGSDTLLYAPALNYTGYDTMYYSVSNGQHSSTAMVVISVFTFSGISEPELASFTLYPNPVKNNLEIRSSQLQNCQVQVSDLTGKSVISSYMTGQSLHLDISALSPGSYFVKITSQQGQKTFRLVKE